MSNQMKIYLLTFVSFLVGTSQFVIAGILDKIAEFYGVSIGAAGQLVTVFAIASGIGTPLLILFLTRYGLKTQLMLSLVLFLMGIFLTPLASSYDTLMLSRVITGMGTSTFVVVSYMLAAKMAKPGRQGSAMADIALGFSLSLVLGVPLGRFITMHYEWQMIFWLLGLSVLFASVFIAWLIPSHARQTNVPFKSQITLLQSPKVALALGITFLVFISYSIISTYITPLLLATGNVTEHQIAVVFLILGVASVIGSKLGASLADRLGIVPILIGSMVVIVVALGLLPLFSTSLLITSMMLVFWTISSWMFGPTQSFNLSKISPESAAVLIGLNSSFVQLGFAAGAGIGGFAINETSVFSLSWIGAVSVIFAIGVAFLAMKQPHPNPIHIND